MIGVRLLLAFLLLSFSIVAEAETPPLPWVGRVAAFDGKLTQRNAGQSDWTNAQANDPVTAGMSLATDAQGQAGLRIGADMVALGPATEIGLAQLDSSGIQIVLRRGRVAVRLSELDPAHSVEIAAPRGGVWLLTPGDYDIVAGDDRTPMRIAVLKGRARFAGGGLDTALATGAAETIGGGKPPLTAQSEKALPDGFDSWWRSTYGGDADPPALRHVSAEMTGYEALDAAGTWRNVAEYGAVWFPKSPPTDWAPYRFGHWRWIAPWGWSWIDDMPWGFAPSHYGRWARIDDPDGGGAQWGWVPGRLTAHPVYAPAIVAFLGTAGIGLSYPDSSGPAVAWFPLAPGEVYWPGYTKDVALIRRLNEGSVANADKLAPGPGGGPAADIVNGAYKNRQFASVVPRPVFVSGRPVAPSLVQLPNRRLTNAPLLAGSPQIAPPAPAAAAPAAKEHAQAAHAVRVSGRALKPRDRVLAEAAHRARLWSLAVLARHARIQRAKRLVHTVAWRQASHRHGRFAVARRR